MNIVSQFFLQIERQLNTQYINFESFAIITTTSPTSKIMGKKFDYRNNSTATDDYCPPVFISLLSLSKKSTFILVTRSNCYELRFTCDEIHFLIHIYFQLRYFCYILVK